VKEEISKLDREKFAKVQQLSREGNCSGALEIMKDLVDSNPRSAVLRSVLAGIFWELGELEIAEKEFKLAVGLDPESEKISLGLFHCLWDRQKKDEAFAEMKRFMAITDSEDYKKIIKEINRQA
jgi:predicted Zn-dependent protease